MISRAVARLWLMLVLVFFVIPIILGALALLPVIIFACLAVYLVVGVSVAALDILEKR